MADWSVWTRDVVSFVFESTLMKMNFTIINPNTSTVLMDRLSRGIVVFVMLISVHQVNSQTFTQTYPPFLDTVGYLRSISWIDYDNDGDLDVYASGTGAYNNGVFDPLHFLYINNGNMNFTLSSELLLPESSFGHGWGDINNDGDIDVLIAKTWNQSQINKFYSNNAGTFTNNQTTGLTPNLTLPYEGTVCWGDYDNDGFLDMYLARWNNQPNKMFHNNGNSTFTEITVGNIVTDAAWSSSGMWFDFDNDNDQDLFVGNYSGYSECNL